MNAYTIEEFEKILKDTKYKHVSLIKPNGGYLVTFNANKMPADVKMEEIKRRLKSPNLPDGVYIIRTKNTLAKKAVCDDFPIIKGDANKINLSEEETPAQMKTAKNNPEVTSYSEVLKMQNRITELTFENSALKKQVEEFEEQIEELEEQIEELEETPKLAEEPQDFLTNAGKWLQQTLIAVQPLIDKHFELKEKQIQNETARLMIAHKAQPAQPAQPAPNEKPHQTTAVQHTINRITNFIQSFAENNDVDTYEELAEIYNGANDLTDFYNKVKAYNEEIFNQMVNAINAK